MFPTLYDLLVVHTTGGGAYIPNVIYSSSTVAHVSCVGCVPYTHADPAQPLTTAGEELSVYDLSADR